MDSALSYDFNPLQSPSPEVWNDLLIAVGPASLLLAIETRMSHALRSRHSVEDVFQEAMLHAWRDRGTCRWSGIRRSRKVSSFRSRFPQR